MSSRVPRFALLSALLLCVACSGGYAARVDDFQARLAARDLPAAEAEVTALIEEARSEEADLHAELPLLLLERAGVYQALGDHQSAVRDLGEADALLEILDLTPEGSEEVGRFLWADDSGDYRAPIYEKLLVNMTAIASYLALGDYSAARVEARRLTVLTEYFEGTELFEHPSLAAAWTLAGLAMELSGEGDSALRYYIDAFALTPTEWLAEAVVRLSPGSNLRRRPEVARAREQLGLGPDDPAPPLPDREVVAIVFSGLGPRRQAVHYPIGLVWGWMTADHYHLDDDDRHVFDRLMAEELLTWVNFPILVLVPQSYQQFSVQVGGASTAAEPVADMGGFALAQWDEERGAVALSAITRAIVRVLAREAVQATGDAMAGDNEAGQTAALLAGLLLQGGMQAADTPDTRSWSTMPAVVWVARLPAEPGPQTVRVTGSGAAGTRVDEVEVDVPAEGSRVVVLRILE